MNHHHPRDIVGETGHGTGTTLAGAVSLGRALHDTDPVGELLSAQFRPAAAGGELPGVRVEFVLLDGPEVPDDL